MEQCFQRLICKEQCKEKTKEMYACIKTANTPKYSCESRCNHNPPHDPASAAVDSCTAENNRTIKSELVKYCKGAADEIEGPGKLICPDGDIKYPCGRFCDKRVPDNLSNMPVCRDITAQQGFDNCFSKLQAQVKAALPQDPKQLPKGFSWQKCALRMPCAQKIEVAFNSVLRKCESLKNKATVCCDDPLKCPEKESSTQGLFTNINPVMGGMAEKCRQIKEKFSSVGNVAQKMSDQCKDSSSACMQICSEKIMEDFQHKFYETCAFDLLAEDSYNPGKHTCSPELIQLYVQKYKDELAPLPAHCEIAGRKADQLAQSAESILESALSAAHCEEQASGGKTPPIPDPSDGQRGEHVFGMTDGHPSALGGDEPSLIWKKPHKNQQLGMEGGGGDSARTSSRSVSTSGNSTDIASHQQQGSGKAVRQSAKAAASKGDKQGAVGAAGGGSTGNGKSGEIKRTDGTNVEQGKTTGKEGKDELSLRQFAGKGSKNQNKKLSWDQIKPRGNLNTRISSFGSPHDNIFQRISNRIVVLCRQEKLHCP